MKTILSVIGAMAFATTAAFASPVSERASVKAPERGDRTISRDAGERMPVSLQRELQMEFNSPAPSDRTPGPRGWSGNENEG